jgi:hypothetical protein
LSLRGTWQSEAVIASFSKQSPAIRCNLLLFKGKSKRISTSIGARRFVVSKHFCTNLNRSFGYICTHKLVEIMAKGLEKNTKNKALHTKLLNRKKAKLQEEKKEKALRLKALVTKINQKRIVTNR